MTLSLKEYIWWSACSWINILEGVLLMLSVPSGSTPAVFLLIWRINIWRDSLGHTLLNVRWRSKIYLCSASSPWSSRDFSTLVQSFPGEGRVSSVCWSLPSSKVMSEGSVAGCVLSHALVPVPELSFEVVYKAAGACGAVGGQSGGGWMSEVIGAGAFYESWSIAERVWALASGKEYPAPSYKKNKRNKKYFEPRYRSHFCRIWVTHLPGRAEPMVMDLDFERNEECLLNELMCRVKKSDTEGWGIGSELWIIALS